MLDSWAVLAYLEDEGAGRQVAEIIGNAHEHGTPLLMSTVNAGEVWYILAREISDTEADNGIESLRLLGIELIDADWKAARTAGTFKSKNKMSFADCFAAALAKEHKADLITGDNEFKQVEHEIKVVWLSGK